MSRFPITVWPGTPLPPTPVERSAVFATSRGKLVWTETLPSRVLPDEWVLRQLRDADLDQDGDVLALLDAGMLTRAYVDPRALPADQRGRIGQFRQGGVEDARWWMRTARALGSFWAADDDDGRAAAWAADGLPVPDDGWDQFVYLLGEGLKPFHVRLEMPRTDGRPDYGAPRLDLYEAACGQLYNLIATDATPRHCQKCGRVFVHQLGGAVHGQHRNTGRLLYCTPWCARAVASRNWREKKKKKEKAKETKR